MKSYCFKEAGMHFGWFAAGVVKTETQ